MEIEKTLTIEELKQLDQGWFRNPQVPEKHAFWAGPMPNPSQRPRYHQVVERLYNEFLDPPVEYVDAYHSVMFAAPVFNETIQDILIGKAAYMVVDLSLPRHDVLFEAGFGLGTGIQTICYFDPRSSIRQAYPTDCNRFPTLNELKKQLPTQLRDSIFAQPPQKVPEGRRVSKRSLSELAKWFNNAIHTPGLRLNRRHCCKVHFEDRECEFQKQLDQLRKDTEAKYTYVSFQEDHREQGQQVRQHLERIGFKPCEDLSSIVENQPPLCRTCFFLQAADRIVVDGTSSDIYSVKVSEHAFTLGMAIGLTKTFARKSAKIKMLYDEQIGPIGMFAGGRAGWHSNNWRDHVARELENW